MNKVILIIVAIVVVIAGLNLFSAAVTKTQSVTDTYSHVGIQALINQPTK